jgi:hypothetical protein
LAGIRNRAPARILDIFPHEPKHHHAVLHDAGARRHTRRVVARRVDQKRAAKLGREVAKLSGHRVLTIQSVDVIIAAFRSSGGGGRCRGSGSGGAGGSGGASGSGGTRGSGSGGASGSGSGSGGASAVWIDAAPDRASRVLGRSVQLVIVAVVVRHRAGGIIKTTG